MVKWALCYPYWIRVSSFVALNVVLKLPSRKPSNQVRLLHVQFKKKGKANLKTTC